ncbi:Rieske 2Fe-2S domain-containing protein [Pseudonocardia sp. K10HN5]|uniref:Rieske 2Fe-2S domain-containing protein n=2 Tax=Pseudonocardia acidicola TaxID=2724939 RepID=A0ABX1S8D2_9PSEU|nr:Rieske 2Fe-2S domain-containing protein [Pseudonocardia acidicola]
MLSPALNERLTRIGPGTPMGTLLRRYWYPVAAVSELGRVPISRRLLGEDIVIYRDGTGRLGCIEAQCPHRRASMRYAVVEEEGLRCGYHGWLFGRDGQCLDQPAEPADSTFKERVRAVTYQAEELGGLIFVYMGPAPAPLLPRFDLFVWDNCLRDIGHAMLPMSWLQVMENSVDPHHVEWLHGHYMNFVRDLAGDPRAKVLARKHEKVAFDLFEYGIIKRRVLQGMTEEDEDWKVGHPLVFPAMLRVGGGGHYQFQIRVPVDDTHTSHFWYSVYKPDGEYTVEPQESVPLFTVPFQDEEGDFLVDFVDGQDIMAWASQGPIADRSREHLGKSDVGVIMLRRLFQEQLDRVAEGEDPLGVVRDEATNECIVLPQEKKKFGAGGAFRSEFLTMGQGRYSPIAEQVLELFERVEQQGASV